MKRPIHKYLSSTSEFCRTSWIFALLLATAAAVCTPLLVRAQDGAASVTEFEVNHLKVLVKKRPGSQTVAGGLYIRGGSQNITADDQGIESLMLDLATRAGTAFPRERLRSELARTGSGIASAAGNDYSSISFTSTRDNFDHTWAMFTDVSLHPAFTKDDFDRARDQWVSILTNEQDDADRYLQKLQDDLVYKGHPYGNLPRGTVQSLNHLTLEQVRQYHKHIMETSRLVLVLVGDLDIRHVRDLVTAAFNNLPRGSYIATPVPDIAFSAPSVDVTKRDLPTNYVQGEFSAPAFVAADASPFQVAINILYDRLFNEVRVKRNLSYAPSAFRISQQAGVGGIYVTAVDANQSVRVMLAEIKKLQEQPVPDDEVAGAIAEFLTYHYMGQMTNAAQAATLAEYEIIGGGWRNSFAMISRVRAVRASDIQAVAKKYMRNIRFTVLGDPASVDRSIFLGG